MFQALHCVQIQKSHFLLNNQVLPETLTLPYLTLPYLTLPYLTLTLTLKCCFVFRTTEAAPDSRSVSDKLSYIYIHPFNAL